MISFLDFDFEAYNLPLLVVYNDPKDYPGKYVMRLWNVDESTDHVIVKDSLDEIHNSIPSRFFNLGRNQHDDGSIVEVWI